MILASAAKAFYETSEFWTAVQAIASLAAVWAAVAALKASNRSHRESGPVITVSMNAYTATISSAGTTTRTETSGQYSSKRSGAPQMEFVLMTVANTGRTAATVKGVYFKIEGIGETKNFRQSAREMPGNEALETATFSSGPIVIEPYSEKKVILDFWGLMNKIFTDHEDAPNVVVTGVADVVGLRKPVESQEDGQWVVHRDHKSFSGDHRRVRPIDVMATELAWKFKDLAVPEYLYQQLLNAEIMKQPDYRHMDVAMSLDPWEQNKQGSLKTHDAVLKVNEASIAIQSKIRMLRKQGFLLAPPSKDGKIPGEKC